MAFTVGKKKPSFLDVSAAVVAGVAALFGFIAVVSVMRGLVLSILWGWFIAARFNAPTLNIGAAIGVSLVVSFFLNNIKTEEGSKAAGQVIFGPLFALLIGYILHTVFGV